MKITGSIIILLFLLLIGKNSIAQNKGSELQIDPRIENHYSADQIKELKQSNPMEIKKLNYYFQNSFIVVPGKTPNAEPIDIMTIDARRFENQRQANERTTIIISANDDKLILKSKEELEKEYKLIK